jgi:hypothetical protein
MNRFHAGVVSTVMLCSILFITCQTSSLTKPLTNGAMALIHHQPRPAAGAAANTTSDNWAGYVQLASNNDTFTGITDTLVVPTAVTPAAGTQYESDWVGIGGFDFDSQEANDRNLIQAGVQLAATTTNGKTSVTYEAWTEKLPGLEKRLKLEVKPGNTVSLTVQETATNRWVATVDDVTTGRSRARTMRYRSTGLSVEAVEERPCLGSEAACAADPDDYAQLAQTSDVTFDPGYFSESAPGLPPVDEPLLSRVPEAALLDITMVDPSAAETPMAKVSAPNAADDGFAVADGTTQPPPPST